VNGHDHSLQKRQKLVETLLGQSDDPPRTIFRLVVALLCAAIVLVGAHLAVTILLADVAARTDDGHIGVFDLDQEGTLGVWFSSVQFMLVAAACLGISWCDRGRKCGVRGGPFWRLAAVLFLFMSADETGVIHEMFGGTMNKTLPGVPLSASMWWAVPYGAVLAVVFLLACLRFMRTPGLVAAVAFAVGLWAGAVFFEQVHLFADNINIAIEEGLEMAGTAVLLGAFGRYLVQVRPGPGITSDGQSAAASVS